jgi:lysine-N-methylase
LPQNPPIHAAYAEDFHCIGSACEDTCCEGWGVPIDQAAYEKYQQLPAGPLRTLIEVNTLKMAEGATKPARFAQFQMSGTNRCPLLREDRLCRIQAELGEQALPLTCAKYPRVVHRVGGTEETALALSCPEAARLVLLSPELRTLELDGLGSAGVAASGLPLLDRWHGPIREAVLALVRDRSYPLWQRLFLLGIFCRRMDTILSGELQRSIPDFLGDFRSTVAAGTLRAPMESLPMDRKAQLDLVLRLAGMLLHRSNVSSRFVECVQAFSSGLGSGPGATLESLVKRCTQAHDRYYAPFFEHHPRMLENYLVNSILRWRFPFGLESATGPLSMSRECAALTAQFALMKGLLIGVAGFHRENFAAAHVVHTVQAASKHFEHHPEFLSLAYELLLESRMDGARGMAILLRNTESMPQPAPEIQVPLLEQDQWAWTN